MKVRISRRFRPLLPEKFSKKSENSCVIFLWSSITYLNGKKKNSQGHSLVETAWNPPYVVFVYVEFVYVDVLYVVFVYVEFAYGEFFYFEIVYSRHFEEKLQFIFLYTLRYVQ